jgi:hypothetical protein
MGRCEALLFPWSKPQSRKRPRVERTWGRPTSGEVGTPWVVNGGHPKRLWNRSPQRSFVPTRRAVRDCNAVTLTAPDSHSTWVRKGPGECRGRVRHSQGECQYPAASGGVPHAPKR